MITILSVIEGWLLLLEPCLVSDHKGGWTSGVIATGIPRTCEGKGGLDGWHPHSLAHTTNFVELIFSIFVKLCFINKGYLN